MKSPRESIKELVNNIVGEVVGSFEDTGGVLLDLEDQALKEIDAYFDAYYKSKVPKKRDVNIPYHKSLCDCEECQHKTHLNTTNFGYNQAIDDFHKREFNSKTPTIDKIMDIFPEYLQTITIHGEGEPNIPHQQVILKKSIPDIARAIYSFFKD